MKNTLWANHLDKHTVSVLNKSGFYTNEDFDHVPVLGLLLMVGIDREDVDELLKALFFEENTWRLGVVDILESATEKEGKRYVKEMFEAYCFDEQPRRFYQMTVRELLDLEFVEERFISFITSLMQRFMVNQTECAAVYFANRADIEENFDEAYDRLHALTGGEYEWYDTGDEDFDDDDFDDDDYEGDDYDDDFEYPED